MVSLWCGKNSQLFLVQSSIHDHPFVLYCNLFLNEDFSIKNEINEIEPLFAMPMFGIGINFLRISHCKLQYLNNNLICIFNEFEWNNTLGNINFAFVKVISKYKSSL